MRTSRSRTRIRARSACRVARRRRRRVSSTLRACLECSWRAATRISSRRKARRTRSVSISSRGATWLAIQRDVVEHEVPRRDHRSAGCVLDRLAGSQQPSATVPRRRAGRRTRGRDARPAADFAAGGDLVLHLQLPAAQCVQPGSDRHRRRPLVSLPDRHRQFRDGRGRVAQAEDGSAVRQRRRGVQRPEHHRHQHHVPVESHVRPRQLRLEPRAG